ncbi:MBL fold metallo-hydrolase [Shewanella eurypsychrophilus]|uniref:MBL fold metallo-hydrolase n=1 Tax=Shewanella eurypsychrophilus TaxID=2593656 RepID=A0ABX6V4U8_9GAMM|nr:MULTISPECIES: MBL fold metallo-hydrolase [Shewanella]QFU22304.1 MBL fold metallo-hydrolase [Shewanella sp. YLB-09]QPG57590.1 MBL fold metallo-hydrolase [Shewanella eurypsychrophilus]
MLGLLLSQVSFADRFADVEISKQKLSETSYMLTGSGGNIGVSAGKDGILIIDNQFAPLSGKIVAALSTIQPGLPRYVVNTHYHGDHTGGNNLFGMNSVIFAHHNVLKRLSGDNSYKAAGLPSVTYHEGTSIHFNEETLHLIHMGPGHTDGDSVVLWEDKSVIHMGDLFFKDRFPYIDLKAGGSVKGYRDNVAAMIRKINTDTKVIPGHGSLATRNDLIRFKHMLDKSINWMESKLSSGMDLEQIQLEGIPKGKIDWSWAFITEEKWINTLYEGLKE